MSTREIRIGKVAGLSSYDLAVKNGTFTGTLAEYLNKEQKYYNDMVTYGNNLKEEINTIIQPATSFISEPAMHTNVATGSVATTIYTKRFPKPIYLTMSAFIQFGVGILATDVTMSVCVNGETICMTNASSANVLNISTNYAISANDELTITVSHGDTVNRLISVSAINLTATERS